MKHKKLSMIIAGAVALIAAPIATAVPTIYIDLGGDGGMDLTATDNISNDGDALAGSVQGQITTGQGGYLVRATGVTKGLIGSATKPQLSSTVVDISYTGTVVIYFTENLYGPSTQSFLAELAINDLLTTAGATVDYYSYATTAAFNPANPGALGAPMTTLNAGLLNTGAVAPAGVTSGSYSLTQKIVITLPTGGTAALNASLKNVPDGGTTLALLGGSLLGLGTIRRKLIKR